jgi:hypothetical protein
VAEDSLTSNTFPRENVEGTIEERQTDIKAFFRFFHFLKINEGTRIEIDPPMLYSIPRHTQPKSAAPEKSQDPISGVYKYPGKEESYQTMVEQQTRHKIDAGGSLICVVSSFFPFSVIFVCKIRELSPHFLHFHLTFQSLILCSEGSTVCQRRTRECDSDDR